MNRGFWGKLKKPIFALAPMANVTDAAFRRIIAERGKPDVMWTEFVSADGLCSKGRKNLLIDLRFSERERPIVAQFFGAAPEHFYRVAQLAQELGFDGIDINMGCPDRSVLKQGAGAALIDNPKLAKEIILAAQRGAGKLPVSVKTRIGGTKNIIREWILRLLDVQPAAVIIHARTRKELSLVPARWETVADAVRVVHEESSPRSRPLVLGNGDVKNLAEARLRARETGADGIMVGRGIFGNPWFFNKRRRLLPSREEKLLVLIEHIRIFNRLLGKHKNFDIMRKHFKAYVGGFDGAKELRISLMCAQDAREAMQVLNRALKQTKSRGESAATR